LSWKPQSGAEIGGFRTEGLGVQEGGLLLAPLCGLPAEDALALSLLKRLRKMVLGGTALIASRSIAARAGMRSASDRETPVNTELS
jgi:hypothetical protein